jgi:hypothetical protein
LLALAGAQAAMGEASGHASCAGLEASGISPPGSSDEFPGGMAQLIAFVRTQGQVGPVVSAFGRLHAGSHEACDAASG